MLVGQSGSESVLRDLRGLLDSLTRNAAVAGDAKAFFQLARDGDGLTNALTWTWSDLDQRVHATAQHLRAETALRPGDRVLLVYPSGLEFLAVFLGCLASGLVPVPVAPPRRRARDDRWAHIARDAGASAVLCAAPVREQAAETGIGPCIVVPAANPACPVPPVADTPHNVPEPGDLAFLQYTSGSTSDPKGVMVTHGMIAANLAQIGAGGGFDYRSGDRTISWLPHYHDMGLFNLLIAVHMGTPHAIASPDMFLRDPIRFLSLAGRFQATVMGGPNFAFDHLLRRATPDALAGIDLSHLRLLFSGSEAIRPETLDAFSKAFQPCGFRPEAWAGCYGMAEATVCVSVAKAGSGTLHLTCGADALAAGRVETGQGAVLAESGEAVPGAEIAIVGPDATALPQGTIGEIWVRGPNVSPGYWQKPEINRQTFDQSLEGSSGWMKTGDLGAMYDGRLFVTGRVKELIVVRGRNHAPQDVEWIAGRAHDDLLPGRIAAFAASERADGNVTMICELRRQALRDPDSAVIFASIRQAVSNAHGFQPERIVLVRPGAIPVTPSGKIRRLACRDMFQPGNSPKTVAEWNAPEDAPDETVEPGLLAAELAALPPALQRGHVLGRLRAELERAGATGIADNERFFDLGLDSVSGVALVARLETQTGLSLDPTVIYEFPTPEALADHLLDRLTPPTPLTAPPDDQTRPATDDDIRALQALLASG